MTSDNLIDGCLLMLQTKDYKNTNNLYHLDICYIYMPASSISNNVVNDSPGLPGVQVPCYI